MSDFGWFCMIPIIGIVMGCAISIVDIIWGKKDD